MQKTVTLKVLPSESGNELALRFSVAGVLSVDSIDITGFQVLKRSIDARGKQVWMMLTLLVFINEPFHERNIQTINFPNVHTSPHRVIVIGSGPAGLFASLKLLEAGIKPIILERGKEVRSRRRDLALLNKEGIIDPDSNYCFGEGGAGTYSDGKLYTRSNKRGDINRILNLFVQFGAEEKILYEAHPHIGTNKLPQIISAMRDMIIASGGEFLFGKKVIDFTITNNIIKSVKTADGNIFEAAAFILATGHSARDIFQLLHNKNILIELKPFALGVRVEHPQQLIDSIQYHASPRETYLPPASYSLVQQVNGRGVFSFCMCPGGIIAPAATNDSELVVNGWSPSKRNNPYANSGIVVSVEESDLGHLQKTYGALAAMYFQQSVEQKAFQYGEGKFVAPAQRMADFINNKISSDLPGCSYVPGVRSVLLKEVLPGFIYNSLADGFKEFGKKMKGYFTNEALIVATESRTSSPVRIPRNPVTLQHPQVSNLYPCSEGAGYAGGIISAAMDGEKVATSISLTLQHS
jgi:uncharacterized FAD-dependent dehydrogenase